MPRVPGSSQRVPGWPPARFALISLPSWRPHCLLAFISLTKFSSHFLEPCSAFTLGVLVKTHLFVRNINTIQTDSGKKGKQLPHITAKSKSSNYRHLWIQNAQAIIRYFYHLPTSHPCSHVLWWATHSVGRMSVLDLRNA